MPDKRLKELVNASKGEQKTRQAELQRRGEAFLRGLIQSGRSAAFSDYESWKRAIEASIGAAGKGELVYINDLTLRYRSESEWATLDGYRRTIFGNYKTHEYRMHGFQDICKSHQKREMIQAYIGELQSMLGEIFKVRGGEGGYEYYKTYNGGIEHDDGTTSSFYRDVSYQTDPSVVVSW